MKSSGHLVVEQRTEEDDLLLVLAGDIDEFSESQEIHLEARSRLILDLKGVKLINSCGLRTWVRWAKSLNTGIQVVFRNCPKVIVDQINILDGFMPSGTTIESFFVPYECENCGFEKSQLVFRGKDFVEGTIERKEGLLISEHIPCPECQSQMDWAFISDKYFKFLKYRR